MMEIRVISNTGMYIYNTIPLPSSSIIIRESLVKF